MLDITFFSISFLLIIAFIFITGFHDEGNLIATIITSRSLNVYLIFLLAFVSQFLGTTLLGTKVAMSTIQMLSLDKICDDARTASQLIFAGVSGAIVWNLFTWKYKIPSSSSHAIIGGLMGPFVLRYGMESIRWRILLLHVILPLFTSPLIGFAFGFLIYRFNCFFFNIYTIKVKSFFQFFQIATCVLVNAFQGSNDSQKGMGVLALLLLLTGRSGSLTVPGNAVLMSALAISLGLVLGGFKMIQSVGSRIFGVRSIHSMSAQTSSLLVIVSASSIGFPISGTQIVNSAVMGVGAADRPGAVGWVYAKNMLTAWVMTIPATFAISALIYLALLIFHI